MTKTAFLISLHFFLIFLIELSAQNNGELFFSQKCIACHTVGKGKLIGPDLANIQDRRTEEWIIKFVQSSQSVIKSGDSAAIAVFDQYNKIVMPDQDLKMNEIKSILDYIRTNSPDANNPNKKTPTQIFNASSITASDIERGKNIFEGTAKLTNNGPPCISCHNIDNPTLFNGGLLAKDLTTVFSRLGAAGIDGIVRNSPFPAMINSFGSAPLTDQEIKDLLAFLYYSNGKGNLQATPLQTQFGLLIGIILGLNIALVVFLFMWQRVKKYSVNFR